MGYFFRDNLLANCNGSIYKLVILASKRAIEIAESQSRTAQAGLFARPSTIALEEIAIGKVQCKQAKAGD
ncbi:MAG: DNA-directed RNA polymerase subunit omega [Candidatus Omnitrophota bacterium]|nr:DNA-directed RNA polymerase subunit omega [Candidatus Omnitrophota bacterium]